VVVRSARWRHRTQERYEYALLTFSAGYQAHAAGWSRTIRGRHTTGRVAMGRTSEVLKRCAMNTLCVSVRVCRCSAVDVL
jgi:hypothetical protein